MSLEIKLNKDDIKKYSDILPQIDERNRKVLETEKYSTDNDGGINSRIGEAYAGYITELGKDAFKNTKNDGESTDQKLNAYMSQIFKAFSPDTYENVEPILSGMDTETKKTYLTNLLDKYIGMPADAIKQSRKQMLETGDVGAGLTSINEILQHPEWGVAKGLARQSLQKELMDSEGSQKLVQYVNETYLNPMGLNMDDRNIAVIAADTQQSIKFVDDIVNGKLTSTNLEKYGIQRYDRQ